MNRKEIKEKIIKLLREKLGGNDFENDELIFGVAGGLDSLALLAFILEVEDSFNIMIADEDLIPENFSSVSCIVDYVIHNLEQ